MYAKFELVPRNRSSDLDFQFGIGVRSFFGTICRIVPRSPVPGQAQAVSRLISDGVDRTACGAARPYRG